jgi:HEAT repeat protein
MTISELLTDKSIKNKEKTVLLSQFVLDKKIKVDDVVLFAEEAKDPLKAVCIEALEFASKQNPSVINKNTFQFLIRSLNSKASNVKWESAKVIGNSAHLFKNDLDEAIKSLLTNTKDSGTVVRWSSAFALGEILKLRTKHNKVLLPAIEKLVDKEEKNSIKKIYLDAVKKTKDN